MKFKLIAVLVGGAVAGALAFLPFSVKAEAPNGLAQVPPIGEEHPFEELNLSPEQEEQLAQIRQETRAQIEDVLSAEQRQQFRTTFEEGRTFREAVAAMNLSEEQKAELRSIFQAARQKAATILTPEQRQHLRERMLSRLGERW